MFKLFVLLGFSFLFIDTDTCPLLNVSIYKQDIINPKDDSNYGVGDDDLFSADDFSVIKVKNGKAENVTSKLNDYNLLSAYKGFLKPDEFDTLDVIIFFKGLTHLKSADTLICIKSIDFFNGNRASLSAWKKSGRVEEIALYHNRACLGRANMANTFKCQSISFGSSNFVYNRRGQRDTIRVVLKSLYKNSVLPSSYSISELKLNGIKFY